MAKMKASKIVIHWGDGEETDISDDVASWSLSDSAHILDGTDEDIRNFLAGRDEMSVSFTVRMTTAASQWLDSLWLGQLIGHGWRRIRDWFRPSAN